MIVNPKVTCDYRKNKILNELSIHFEINNFLFLIVKIKISKRI